MITWDELEAEVAGHVRGLRDGGFVVVEAPGAPGREYVARPARLGGLIKERRAVERPFAQAIRIRTALRGELAGPPSLRGTYPWTEEEQRRILALGWAVPVDPPGFAQPNYIRDWPDHVADADDAAAFLLRSLRELGPVASPDGLEVRVCPTG